MFARSGEEAVTMFEASEPNIVLMDWRMPGMNGAEATRQLKATPRGQQTPIVSISASAFEENRLEALDCKSDGFIAKPIQVDEVLNELASQLNIEFDWIDTTETWASRHSGDVERLTDEGENAPPTQLSDDTRNDLLQAAFACDYPRLAELEENIREVDPDFAATIRRNLRDYDYEELVSLLQAA
ncbi:MAG: response regulator [Verrucomicrobiota bacterium]